MSDDVSAEVRSPEARARAERALVTLVAQINDDSVPLIVLGGLLPEVLTEGNEAAPQHLGTTDVDMVVAAHLSRGANFSSLERALEEIEFSCDRGEGGWRWRGTVDGYAIKLEFLCDVETERAEELIAVEGCTTLKAMNLRGTGFVALDWRWRALSAQLTSSGPTYVNVRFAGLEGYLLSKCVAARRRGAAKDYYDLTFVLIHNQAGSPTAAAERLRSGKLSHRLPGLRSTLLEVRARFYSPASDGPKGYASQSRLIDFETPNNELQAQAVAAVNEFVAALLL